MSLQTLTEKNTWHEDSDWFYTIGCYGFHNVEIKPGELVSLCGSPSTYSIEWSSVRLNSGIISSTHSGGTRLVLLESFWIVSWVIKLVILLESLWINVMLVIILVCIALLQSIEKILVLLIKLLMIIHWYFWYDSHWWYSYTTYITDKRIL